MRYPGRTLFTALIIMFLIYACQYKGPGPMPAPIVLTTATADLPRLIATFTPGYSTPVPTKTAVPATPTFEPEWFATLMCWTSTGSAADYGFRVSIGPMKNFRVVLEKTGCEKTSLIQGFEFRPETATFVNTNGDWIKIVVVRNDKVVQWRFEWSSLQDELVCGINDQIFSKGRGIRHVDGTRIIELETLGLPDPAVAECSLGNVKIVVEYIAKAPSSPEE